MHPNSVEKEVSVSKHTAEVSSCKVLTIPEMTVLHEAGLARRDGTSTRGAGVNGEVAPSSVYFRLKYCINGVRLKNHNSS